MKLVVNAYMSILIEGVAEALELAGRLGIDLVFQDADDDRLVFRGPPSCLVQRGRCADAVRGDRGQVGVVRQALQHRQSQAGRYREQQIRACLACGGEEVIAVEAAVKDDQHSLLTIGQHVLRQFAFAGADRAQFGDDDGMRAALAQSEHPQLRERATVAGPEAGRPNAASFSPVSGTSRVTPSMAISRQQPSQAPIVAGVATGAAARSNSRRTGCSPRRWRAWHNAEGVGTCQCRSQAETNRTRRPSFASLLRRPRRKTTLRRSRNRRPAGPATGGYAIPCSAFRRLPHRLGHVINAGHHAQAQVIRQPASP